MTASKTSPARTSEYTEDQPSFEEAFLKHWASIYRLLVRLVGDPAEAEDLALETFFRLYQRPPQMGDSLNLGGWLWRVATNLGLHSIRSDRRRGQYELSAGKDALDEAFNLRPDEIASAAEEKRLARRALAQMQDRPARLLILRYSGMAYKDIAAELGLSASSIGPLLLRAEREFERRYRILSGGNGE